MTSGPTATKQAAAMRILLAEDEQALCEQVKKVLSAEGRVVDVANDGQEAWFLGATETYDMIILDIGLPMRDGISILKEWRSSGMMSPVLILTARDGWSDRVDGLDAGADDYMTKPFHLPELAARVRATLRRSSGRTSSLFEKDGIVFDTRSGRATRAGVPVDLTAQEVAVLAYLIHNSGRLISRTELSEHIYEYDADRDSNTIAVFINRLRNKLGADLIQTVRGRGYMIEPP
jgi:two-component system OmpR family response regulator